MEKNKKCFSHCDLFFHMLVEKRNYSLKYNKNMCGKHSDLKKSTDLKKYQMWIIFIVIKNYFLSKK